jgi:hypothetical protein
MRDAPAYLGMDKNRFNVEVRPYLTEIPLGAQCIAFDRLDLDSWVDQYIERNGRKRATDKGGKQCQNAQPVSLKEARPGTSTRKSGGTEGFTKALELIRSKKLNAIS